MAGLGPAIHVFVAEIVAGSRRGCPGHARARGLWNQNVRQNARVDHQFPRAVLRESGNPGLKCSKLLLDPRFRGGDD